jgi:tetratricopeptide (TPR) repeat protein
MRWRGIWPVIILSVLVLPARTASADDQVDRLRDLAKQAKDKGDLDQEANYLCEAASLDPSKYKKRCERAQADVAKETQIFEAAFQTGKFELQQKDYAGAVRDLSKISFGPHRDDAQRMIQQAKIFISGGTDAVSLATLRQAQAAYQKGDFDTAATQASQVQSPAFQPQAKQLLTNIKVYQDTMAQAAVLAQNNDYKGAEEKYAFAMKINPNGPGVPADKLKELDAKEMAIQQAAAKPQEVTGDTKTAPPAKVDYAAKVKSDLADARHHEAKGDYKAAIRAFDDALLIDGRQAEALAGKQRVIAKLRDDPKALEDSLEDGIRNYYSSDFEQASKSITLYLSSGGVHNKGAAHFYLAASLFSQSVFTDPHDDEHVRSLQQQAEEQFAMARQEKYKPVEKLVSPKVLTEWTKSGSRQ